MRRKLGLMMCFLSALLSFALLSLYVPALLAAEESVPMSADSDDVKGGNVIVKYKKYEKFDLGDLEIKGNVIAPGDLTVRDRGVTKFSRKLFDRFDFDREIEEHVRSLR